MQNFNEFYSSQQVLKESLMKELGTVAVAVALATITGSVLMNSSLMKDKQHVKQELIQAKQQGYDVQEIIDKSKQPEIKQQALQIIKQDAKQQPVVQQKKQDTVNKVSTMLAKPKLAQPVQPPMKPAKQMQAPVQNKDIKQIVADVLKELKVYSPQAQAVMLANIRGEAGPEMKPRSENLNYSANGLLKTFSKYFTPATAKIYARNPEKIANKVYGNRLGNGANEGYKYRGRGYFQITGKENYERMSKLINVDLVKNPDLVNDPQISEKILKAQIAAMIKRGVDLKNVKSVTKFIGPAKLSERVKQRTEWYKLILPSLKDTQEDLPLINPVYQTVIP
jgi:putative chitinase